MVALRWCSIRTWLPCRAAKSFLIEAEAAAKLDHPNIVPIYEIADLEGQHFFSMRLIDGAEDRAWRIRSTERGNGRFTGRDKAQERVATLMAAVSRAVHYAHERGVLHRDLKPSNILIDKQGQPHLTDFGLAKIADKTDDANTGDDGAGHARYMAPEQALGATTQAAGDVYSLGAILCRCSLASCRSTGQRRWRFFAAPKRMNPSARVAPMRAWTTIL